VITLLVFYLHIVAMAWAFTKRWQEEGTGEGLLAVFFMALIFFVGWSMTSFLLKLVMDREGFGVWFDRDAASLVVLTLSEAALYTLFLRGKAPKVSDVQPGK
jgi:uncharacterized membrane protein YhdT